MASCNANASDDDQLSANSLELLVDERLAAITNKCIPNYLSLLKSWQGTLTRAEEWFRTHHRDFTELADTICAEHATSDKAVSHDHTYSRKHCCESHVADNGHLQPPLDPFPPLSLLVLRNCMHCNLEVEMAQGQCWNKTSLPSWQKYNPLSIPILLDWQRVVYQRLDSHIDVVYVSPCGRQLRSVEEIQQFLRATGMSTMEIMQFTFDPHCSVQSFKYSPRSDGAQVYIRDVSQGRERRPVSCVNSLNNEYPDHFEYTTARTHEPNVAISMEPEFLVSCSCTDDCTNRSQCECWQLTIEEARAIGETQHSVGYFHHRLRREQLSAIYECNRRCKCGPQCANRVVQNGLQHRLQIFRTSVRGWGLRTLDDIPKGSFVCTYIGHIYTEQGGEEHAIHYGDEYFADLDYIEVMEHHKEGYESDVDAMSECSSPSSSGDDSAYSVESVGSMRVRLRKLVPATLPSEMEIDASPYSSTATTPNVPRRLSPATPTSPSTGSTLSSVPPPFSPRPSAMKQQGMRTRRFFNEDYSYIMDAKTRGNLGRYINHSCSPDLFVQNVFIDTHDLRFPWVAFFAKRRIKALQELTWDYNYDVGSVEGKNIQCLCGAPNCKGRLL